MTKPIPWKTSEILEATKGKLLFGDTDNSFSDVSIDSREISDDSIFVAVKGENHDGHSFTGNVAENGVRCLIVNKDKVGELPCNEWKEKGVVCIAVKDTVKALGHLAAYNRERSNVSVAAITGSNGKTSTRAMTVAVLSERFNTLSPKGNYNNEIGVPLTLLNLSHDHEWAVIELGMNHFGEIEMLAEICDPDIGIITNIGPAHLKGVGSIEGVMCAKGELMGKIKPTGAAVLNADDSRVAKCGEKSAARGVRNLLYSGTGNPESEIRALSVKEKGYETSFTLVLPEESVPVAIGVPGSFMVSNALAAACAGYLAGLSAKEISQGLENFKPVHGRMNILDTDRGIHIIDDTYNANPGSMEAALTTLRSLKGSKRGIFVAGDMLELGEHSESMHKKIGSLAVRYSVAKLYAFGNFAEAVAEGAMTEGMNPKDILTGTKKQITKHLEDLLEPGDWLLVKGSRGMRMEEIVEEIGK
ncbi:MAG: UDP-N-acetylmuramoyl-tripeptide--D-alanyl-D-alanine ligase [Desulfobacteraceae bacterium]|nr:UDP-N-acetylmuramoyl-tripeptide--D-alanyl-D-alanine ligase [Desulfobacteraceae bacterium]